MATQPAMFPEIDSPDFVRNDGVREVGEAVIRLHGGIGGVSRLHPIAEAVGEGELSILWLLNTKPFDPEKEADEHGVAGKCVKAPGLWRDVTGYHFAIWIRQHFWLEWPTEVQRAAVLHELLHIDVERDKNGQAKFSVRKHDVEDFVDVVRQYGPLFGDGARLVRAAAQHAGEPEPIGKRPVAEAIADLARVTQDGGVESITVTHGSESVTLDAAASRRIDKKLGRPTPDVGDAVVVDGLKHRIRAVDGGSVELSVSGPNWKRSPVVSTVAASALRWDAIPEVWRVAKS